MVPGRAPGHLRCVGHAPYPGTGGPVKIEITEERAAVWAVLGAYLWAVWVLLLRPSPQCRKCHDDKNRGK
jgi:hypothetical protein